MLFPPIITWCMCTFNGSFVLLYTTSHVSYVPSLAAPSQSLKETLFTSNTHRHAPSLSLHPPPPPLSLRLPSLFIPLPSSPSCHPSLIPLPSSPSLHPLPSSLSLHPSPPTPPPPPGDHPLPPAPAPAGAVPRHQGEDLAGRPLCGAERRQGTQ